MSEKSLNVPTAEETDGETKTSKGREKDGADSDTDNKLSDSPLSKSSTNKDYDEKENSSETNDGIDNFTKEINYQPEQDVTSKETHGPDREPSDNKDKISEHSFAGPIKEDEGGDEHVIIKTPNENGNENTNEQRSDDNIAEESKDKQDVDIRPLSTEKDAINLQEIESPIPKSSNDKVLSYQSNQDAEHDIENEETGKIRSPETKTKVQKGDENENDDRLQDSHSLKNNEEDRVKYRETLTKSEARSNESSVENLVASPTKSKNETVQSLQSPTVRSGTKHKNELEWEEVSQDETTALAENELNSDSQDKKDISKSPDQFSVNSDRDKSEEKYDNDFESDTKSHDSKPIEKNNEPNQNLSDDDETHAAPDENEKPSARSEDERHVVIAPEVKISSAKEKEKSTLSNKSNQSKSPRQQDTRNRVTTSPRHQNYNQKQDERKFRRPVHSAPVKSQGSTNRPKTTEGRRCYSRASTSGKQRKEYKTEELRRLQEILRKEKSHIRKPKQRAHFPFVWTSLEPYYNTNTAAFLIDLPEEFRHSYVSRNTAIGLCDPWVDLKMDHEILPKISSAQRTSTRCTHSTERSRERERKEKEAKEKKEKKGSTRLPKFPVVPFHAGKENATMRFPYQDIPKFRQEMDQRFSLHAPKKVENDYKRTKDDFYRMELDRLDEVHPLNRTHMRKAYFAYLQNTPGSKKAITECVRSLEGSVQQNSSGSAQKAH